MKKKRKKSLVGWTYKKWLTGFGYRNITKARKKDDTAWLTWLGGNSIETPRVYRKKNDRVDGREHVLKRIPIRKVRITIEEI